MKNRRPSQTPGVFLLVILVLLTVPGCTYISLLPLPADVASEVEDSINHGFDAVVVHVDQTGKSRTYTAGVMDRLSQSPISEDSQFKIASISKMFIASAIVFLIDEGLLSLDANLASLLPELANRIENSETISVRNMVQHRSGIPNTTDSPDWRWYPLPPTVDANLDFVLDQPAQFSPDERYQYSNTNYLLLGKIMDRVLGYSHHRYIDQKILDPLGLENTFNVMSETNPDLIISGYDRGDGEYDWKAADYVTAGGSMVSTASDTAAFVRTLIDGTLFNDQQQQLYSALYPYKHTGLLPGYQSIVEYHADIDAVVVLFTNVSGGDRWLRSEEIYGRILKILRR